MGISSSKSKTTTSSSSTPLDQYAPYINQGLSNAQHVLDTNQSNLGEMSQNAYGLFNNLAGTINSPNGYVSGAQNAAANIYAGNGPGSATYARLQQAGPNDPSAPLLAHYAGGGSDPSVALLTRLAQGSASPGDYTGIGANNPAIASLQSMMTAGINPADARAQAAADGQYLGAQPSSQFYADTLGGKYLNANPYLDAIVQQSDDAATKAVNRRFAASGMGAGLSTPYADLLSRNLADSESRLRYGAYNDELGRMGTIGAQSDSVWSGERARMDAANAQLANDFNANQDRALQAANDLGSQYSAGAQLQLNAQQAGDAAYNNDRAASLAGAQALGSQYLGGQGQAIDAAKALGSQYAADNATALGGANGQVAAILQALGQTGALADAQYAGVSPALQALSSAASIPYTGINNYAALVNGLTGKYGNSNSTEVKTSTPSLFDQVETGLSLGSSLMGGLGRLMPAGGGSNGILSMLASGNSPIGFTGLTAAQTAALNGALNIN